MVEEKQKKQKKVRKHFRNNVAMLLLIVLLFTVFALIGYYYGEMNQLIDFKVTSSNLLLYSVCLAFEVGLGIYIYQEEPSKKSKVQLLTYVGVCILIFSFAIIQMLFLQKIVWLAVGAKVLVVFALLFSVMTTCNYFSHKFISYITRKRKVQMLTKTEITHFAYVYVMLVFIMTSMPMLILQENSLTEQLLLAVLLGLGTIVYALMSYLSIKKHLFVEDETLVDQYRYLTLKSIVLPRQEQAIEQQIEEALGRNSEYKTIIDAAELERKELMDLHERRPISEQKLAELVERLAVYKKDELEARVASSLEKEENIKQKIWADGYGAEYKEKSDLVIQNEEQLQAAQAELTEKTEQLHQLKLKLEAQNMELARLLDEQADEKSLRNDITNSKENQMALLTDSDLDEKEIKAIQAKIEKLTKKETATDQAINKSEDNIVLLRAKKEKIIEQMALLDKTDIPDLSYVISKKEEALTEDKKMMGKIEADYLQALANDFDLANVKEIIKSTEQQLQLVAELEAEKEALHKELSIDIEAEIEQVDNHVKEKLDLIAEQMLEVERLENEKTETIKKIKQVDTELVALEQQL